MKNIKLLTTLILGSVITGQSFASADPMQGTNSVGQNSDSHVQGSKAGDTPTTFNTIVSLIAGNDIYEAEELFKDIFEGQKDPRAMYFLGKLLEFQFNSDRSNKGLQSEVKKLYKKAADMGSADAAYALSGFLWSFATSNNEYDELLEWRKKAAELGNTRAMLDLARSSKTPEEAEKWYRMAAETGDPDAVYEYADFLINQGRTDEAGVWYKKAADMGDPYAMYCYADFLVNQGRTDEAIKWYKKAAEQGSLDAMIWIAQNSEDPAEAEQWYTKAIQSGDPYAMCEYAKFLVNQGRIDEAEAWYSEAIKSGDPDAMCEYAGFLVNQGRIDEAIKLYREAADMGSGDAKEKLEELEAQRNDQ